MRKTALFFIFILSISAAWVPPFAAASSARPPQSFSADELRRVLADIQSDHAWLEANEKTGRFPEGASRRAEGGDDLVLEQAADVRHYKLALEVTPGTTIISGTVEMTVRATKNDFSSFVVDLDDQLDVKSLVVTGLDSATRGFERSRNRITIPFSKPVSLGREFTVSIAYGGTPRSFSSLGGGSGAVFFTSHLGTPIVATLSEPYGAPSWWPCADNPADKATLEMSVTVPNEHTAACNGTLVDVLDAGGGRRTFVWREAYPISTYLVSMAVTNFRRIDDEYTALDGTRMPITHYVYPEHFDVARPKFARTRRMMEIFAPLFGEYPFVKEKYGMAEFPWGGGMEHQTLTSLGAGVVASGSTSEGIIAHELGHQWWGDDVTLRNWNDIWLNEGFATYSEVIYFENAYRLKPGDIMTESYDDGRAAGRLRGTVHAENPANPFDDTPAIYTKGAWVLHMLRGLMGDETFFAMLKEYRRQHGYGNASTADFQRVCEQFHGAPLDEFFNQWVYSPQRPIYAFASSSKPTADGKFIVYARVAQLQEHPLKGRTEPSIYKMPIRVTVALDGGERRTFTIFNRFRSQVFALEVPARPTEVVFDPDNFLLKETAQSGAPNLKQALSMAASANVTEGRAPLTVEFSGTAGGALLPAGQMTWATDKAVIGQGGTLRHTFEKPGLYDVTLTGVNKKTASTSAPIRIVVNP